MTFYDSRRSAINLSRVLNTIYAFAVIIVIGLMILSLVIGVYTFFFTEMYIDARSEPAGFIFLFFIGQPIIVPAPFTLSQLFAVLWIAYAALFVTSFVGPNASILQVFRQVWKKGPENLFKNGVTAVAATFPLLASVISFIEFLQERVGITSGFLPEQDPAQAFTLITLAPIVEEVGFRVSIIGLVVALWLVSQGDKLKALKSLVFPSFYIDPSKRLMHSTSIIIMIAIVVSALLFGYAHVALGSGWQWGKVSTATLAGIVLGWMYVKRGLPAAILLHWSFNYLTSSFDYFDKAMNTLLYQYMEGMIIFAGVLVAISLVQLILQKSLAKLNQNTHSGS